MPAQSCRCCNRRGLSPLWTDRDGGRWFRCPHCGCDSSEWEWESTCGMYDVDYVGAHHGLSGVEELVASMHANLTWFGHHAEGPGRDFLDVGCDFGAGLTGMARLGWSVHGFDVNPAAKTASPPGDHVTIAPGFRASLFPQRYDAVLCREVLEHVPGWRNFLSELCRAVRPSGLLQVQTPRPAARNDRIPYQKAHLQLFAPEFLRRELEARGLSILDSRIWDIGQAMLCRRKAA